MAKISAHDLELPEDVLLALRIHCLKQKKAIRRFIAELIEDWHKKENEKND